MSVMAIMAAMGSAFGGLAAIAVTMDRHYADLHGRGAEVSARLRLCMRSAGWLAILLAFSGSVMARGWHVGPVLWLGVLTASGLVLTLLLQYAPRHAVRVAQLAAVGALVAASYLLVKI